VTSASRDLASRDGKANNLLPQPSLTPRLHWRAEPCPVHSTITWLAGIGYDVFGSLPILSLFGPRRGGGLAISSLLVFGTLAPTFFLLLCWGGQGRSYLGSNLATGTETKMMGYNHILARRPTLTLYELHSSPGWFVSARPSAKRERTYSLLAGPSLSM
jgi:hypothetical protein